MKVKDRLRELPPIDQLQKHPKIKKLRRKHSIPKETMTNWLSECVEDLRKQILQSILSEKTNTRDQMIDLVLTNLTKKVRSFKEDRLQKVINATGVVLHTNLGRARLSNRAITQLTEVASHYSTLEYDVHSGKRGSRHDVVEEDLKELTGAEAAIVVNNNAAAVYFILKAFAKGKEVIVSRGELVEIGGSFRISEIMEESGALLKSVGTSNKTYVSDYEKAITEETALLLKVHKSNFAMIGFTHEVDTKDLKELSKRYRIPIYEDLGSGTLFDFQAHQIGREPTVQEKVNTGVDLISFSGDKLLGGPQAGIIVGKKQYIDVLKKHQLARVLRVDKFTLAALEATLKTYMVGEEENQIPTVRDILETKEEILKRAETFIKKGKKQLKTFTFTIQEDTSKVGGGTMPEEQLETYVVCAKHEKYTSEQIARKLRKRKVPIIVRVKENQILLDFRTISDVEINQVLEGLSNIEEK